MLVRTLLLVFAILLAGCADDVEQDAPERASAEPTSGALLVPWPAPGSRATYAADGWGTIGVDVRAPVEVSDGTGARVVALPVRIQVDTAFDGEAVRAEVWHLFDSAGTRFMAFSPCLALTVYATTAAGCRDDGHIAVTYVDHGWAGALGSNFYWGRAIEAGEHTREVPLFAGTTTVHERVVRDPSGNCASVALAAAEDWGRERAIFPLMSSLPRALRVCGGDPFPLEVDMPGAPPLRRLDATATIGQPPVGREAASPWTAPLAPGARAATPATLGDATYDPSHASFTLAEMMDALAADPRSSGIARAEDATLRHAMVQAQGTAALRIGVQVEARTSRLVDLVAGDRQLTARVTKTCSLVGCEVGVDEVDVRANNLTTLPTGTRVSLPYRELEAIANATGLPAEISAFFAGAVLRDLRDAPDIPIQREYVVEPHATSPSGLPAKVALLSGSGAILSYAVPYARAADGPTLWALSAP